MTLTSRDVVEPPEFRRASRRAPEFSGGKAQMARKVRAAMEKAGADRIAEGLAGGTG